MAPHGNTRRRRKDGTDCDGALRNALWLFGTGDQSILCWARKQVQAWVPALTAAPAQFTDQLGPGLTIVVGSPGSNAAIEQAAGQGVLDINALGPDDFILKRTVLSGHPVLLIAGGSPRAAVYGVCELFERMGCTFLISGDRLPPLNPDLRIPPLDETQHTDCSWRGIWFGGYCFVANAMFSLPDYEAMFDQMLKLKMNRIIFYHFPQEPFIDYTWQGERKLVGDISHPDSGFISYGREFTGSWRVEDMPVGRQQFDREKLCPLEFQQVTNSDEALDTARAFMQTIIAMAQERDIGVWTSFLPQFTTPNFSKYTRPMSRPHSHWSAHLSCTDPAVGPLNRARLEGILQAYPGLEGIFLSIPEGFFDDPYPETAALIEREWNKYAEALQLLRQHWGKFWPGTERQNQHMRADIAFTEIAKRTIAEANTLDPGLRLGICTVCKAYLLTHLHDILPPDMPFVDIESRALWTLDGAPLHLFQKMKGRECAIIPRAVDDGSLAGMQFPLWQYSQDRFLESAAENGTAGLMIQTTHIRGNEHSMRYLAGGMWDGKRDPGEFYREYARRLFGDGAAERVAEAFGILERNDEFLGGRGQKNLPWNMVPPQIQVMQSFRDFDRPFHRCPLSPGTVQSFEQKAGMFRTAVEHLTQALALLEGAAVPAHTSGRSELDYIVARTRGYRAHLQALVDIAALYRRYYELFEGLRDKLTVAQREPSEWGPVQHERSRADVTATWREPGERQAGAGDQSGSWHQDAQAGAGDQSGSRHQGSQPEAAAAGRRSGEGHTAFPHGRSGEGDTAHQPGSHGLTVSPSANGGLAAFRRELGALVSDAARLEARTRESAGHFAACVEHTTDLAVLWMISHKMVLGTQCLRQFLTNIQAFYDGREYWDPVLWGKLFGRSVFPPYTIDNPASEGALPEGVPPKAEPG